MSKQFVGSVMHCSILFKSWLFAASVDTVSDKTGQDESLLWGKGSDHSLSQSFFKKIFKFKVFTAYKHCIGPIAPKIRFGSVDRE